MSGFPHKETLKLIEDIWHNSAIPTLSKYIEIPNQSPGFDDNWATNGLQEQVVDLFCSWVTDQKVEGLQMEVVKLPKRTPLILIEIASTADVPQDAGTVLMYGHCDKQPPFSGWHEGLDPYKPVIKDGRLYGRGGADDGYALFSSVAAIKTLKAQNINHARCVIIIEAAEESGSPDLPAYIAHLSARIGSPNFVICLDSGAGNFEQLWCTSSLRGMVVGTLKVDVLAEGVHSGDASGVVPDTFRIARNLLNRLECPITGKIIPEALNPPISSQRLEQAARTAEILGVSGMVSCFPFLQGVEAVESKSNLTELALNRWHRAQLTVIGAAGLPTPAQSGNVLRPTTSLTLSLRLPPTLDKEIAVVTLNNLFTRNVPYNAKVSFDIKKSGSGWSAPDVAPWLDDALNNASNVFFGKPAMHMGEGGSIPFMGMLGKLFPKAQFCVTGVLGPHSNAHGPNEFLHIDFSLKLTCSVASILAQHCSSNVEASLKVENPSKKAKIADVRDDFGRNSDGTKY